MSNVAEAFDKDLSTFWLSTTPRTTNDRIVAWFKPSADIAAFTIYAGDPTGAQVVPQVIQMTFYGPREIVHYPPPTFYPPPEDRDGTLKTTKPLPYWEIKSVQEWTLLDTAGTAAVLDRRPD